MDDRVRWTRWTPWCGLALCVLLGCNDSVATVSDAGGSGTAAEATTTDDTGDALAPCESVLDPSIYVAPVWSPTPFVATDDCPAVDGPVAVDLSTVTLGGVMRVNGVPTAGTSARLVGRSGEGEVTLASADDGTFTTTILPGRYDVWVSNAPGALVVVERRVLEDVELTAPTELTLDIPPLVTVTGTMTIDGALAPDPTAHVFVKEVGSSADSPFAYPLVARMDRGTYSIQLAPGTYEFQYNQCEPDWASMIHVGENPCYDPEIGEVSPPYESPNQIGVPIAKDVIVDQDLQLDLDVPTVRFSGSITVDGIHPEELNAALVTDEGFGIIGSADFDVRAIVGTYEFWVGGAPPVDEALVLDEDTHVDVALETFSMSISLDPQRPPIDVPYDSGPRVRVRSLDGNGAWDLDLPVEEPLRVYPGHYEFDHLTRYCWPDYPWTLPSVWTRVHESLLVDASLDVELPAPALARIELEYADLGAPEHPQLILYPVDDPDPIAFELQFFPDEPSFVAHGIVPAGTYLVRGEPVEVVDGTRIRVIEESQWVELQLTVDGVPVGSVERLRLGEELLDEGGELIRPGRYEIRLWPGENEALPRNHGATVGCVTVEG